MSLTRAENEFIESLNSLDEEDIDKVESLIKSGSRPNSPEERVNWGSAEFSKKFNELLTSKLSEKILFAICISLLRNKTFDSAPLRQVHLFSHLYAELIKRNLHELEKENPQMPEVLRLLNGEIFLQNIYIFDNSKKRGEDATYDCINNFLYMREPELQALMGYQDEKTAKEKYDQIQKMFFDDIKQHVQKQEVRQARTGKLKTVSRMPSSPALARKTLSEKPEPKKEEQLKEDAAPPKSPAPPRKKTIIEEQLAKQYEGVKAQRSMSTGNVKAPSGRLFDAKSEPKKPQESKSDPLKLTKK